MGWNEILVQVSTLSEHRQLMDECCYRRDTMGALRQLGKMLEIQRDLAGDLVEVGVHDQLTQAGMARALGLPPSALRGAKREFGAA